MLFSNMCVTEAFYQHVFDGGSVIVTVNNYQVEGNTDFILVKLAYCEFVNLFACKNQFNLLSTIGTSLFVLLFFFSCEIS